MIKRLSSNELKQKLGSVLSSVEKSGDEIIVESHGKPRVALIPYEEFEVLIDLREKKRRADLLEELRKLGERIGDRNKDLTEEQIEELSNRFAHEFIDDLAAEGKIRFERDRIPTSSTS